jgi:dTDP-4-dehydrorhamnose reductase
LSRLLITGGSGYMGCHLVPRASHKHELIYTYFKKDPLALDCGRQLDIRDNQAVRQIVSKWQPDFIIHTTGSNRSPDMERVIIQGAENISQAAETAGARLIHISSDVIFDGRAGPYTESASARPLHAYGRAKVAAEEAVATQPNHVIIRTSLIYSLVMMDHSTAWIVNTLKAGKPVTLFEDQLRNPVWVETLNLACLELVDSAFRGTINVAGRQAVNRVEYGARLLDWWRIDDRERLITGPSPDQWPRDCRLDLTLAKKVLKTPLFGLDEVVSFRR